MSNLSTNVNSHEVSKETVKKLISDIKLVSSETKMDINQVIEIWKIAVLDRANDINVERSEFSNLQGNNICSILNNIAENTHGISVQLEQ